MFTELIKEVEVKDIPSNGQSSHSTEYPVKNCGDFFRDDRMCEFDEDCDPSCEDYDDCLEEHCEDMDNQCVHCFLKETCER